MYIYIYIRFPGGIPNERSELIYYFCSPQGFHLYTYIYVCVCVFAHAGMQYMRCCFWGSPQRNYSQLQEAPHLEHQVFLSFLQSHGSTIAFFSQSVVMKPAIDRSLLDKKHIYIYIQIRFPGGTPHERREFIYYVGSPQGFHLYIYIY